MCSQQQKHDKIKVSSWKRTCSWTELTQPRQHGWTWVNRPWAALMVSSYPMNLKALNWFLGLESLSITQDQGSPHCAFQHMCLRVMQLLNFVPSHTTFFLFAIQTRNRTVFDCIHYPELHLTQVVALCSSYVIYRTELLYSLKHKNLVWICLFSHISTIWTWEWGTKINWNILLYALRHKWRLGLHWTSLIWWL